MLIDRDFIRRSITVLALLKGGVRDIELGLDLLFGDMRSVGYISETLQEVVPFSIIKWGCFRLTKQWDNLRGHVTGLAGTEHPVSRSR